MKKSIEIAPVGIFQRDEDDGGFYSSQHVYVDFLNKSNVQFTIYDLDNQVKLKDFSKAIDNLFSLGDRDKRRLARKMFANYEEYIECVDCDDLEIIRKPKDVWHHVQFTSIELKRDEDSGVVYALVYGECDWEVEHGIQAVFRKGSLLTRVSDWDCQIE